MNSLIYIGMDVHKDSYTLCTYSKVKDEIMFKQRVKADYKMVIKYIDNLKFHYGFETKFVIGYEAGCLGYSLYNQLKVFGIECIILAPSTMSIVNTGRVKTDRNDAENIAKNLAFNTYSSVYIPDELDQQVKNYIRMRDDLKLSLKKLKQQISSFVLRQGLKYCDEDETKNYWTLAHIKWLKALEFDGMTKEAFDEYLNEYNHLVTKLERIDVRINEVAKEERYDEKVKSLSCFLGIKTYTALSLIVEIGDFNRFESAQKFAKYIGIVPSEDSSGGSVRRGSITKAGNSIVRKLLVEAAQAYSRGTIGHKSKELNKRHAQCSAEMVAYADKANERLRRRFYKFVLGSKKNRNVAVTATARELGCFVWGSMTGNIS